MKLMVILTMIFLHIIDDYCLQGILASMKQKRWWDKNYPDQLYSNDYIIALLTHAFSWTFMMMLPINYLSIKYMGRVVIEVFLINWVIHAIVDHLKANALVINLIQDQTIHILQIIITAQYISETYHLF